MLLAKKVAVINSGSAFRGLIGTVVEITASGMCRVEFDRPFYGKTEAFFLPGELGPIA